MENKKSIVHRIFFSTAIKIILGFVACIVAIGLTQWGANSFLKKVGITNSGMIAQVLSSIVVLFVYLLLYKSYEKKSAVELGFHGLGKNLMLGIGLGVALQSLTILVMYLNGNYEIVSVNPILSMIPAFVMAFSSGVSEEILFRGILFRLIENKLGSYLALVISALLFGFLHFGNPNSSFINALGLAIQAGLLLGAAYMYTRSLWLPIGLHFAWNFTQAGIYGANVSGHEIGSSIFTSIIDGNKWITGGEFGPEGSIQATLFCLVVTIILLYWCHQKGHIIAPYWKEQA